VPVPRTMKIADIKIGKRHRRDMGDIAALAASIEDVGLMHPAVVTPDGRLIAGERRIRALKHLGRKEIAVTVVDLDKVVRGEYAENIFRKQFVPSEWADIEDALLASASAKAKHRQRQAGPQSGRGKKASGVGKLPEPVKGRAVDTVARVIGRGRRTVEKARAVRDAARAEPERFGKLQDDMNRTGNVNGPYKRLKVARQAAIIRAEPPPYPNRGPYRVGTADPPWPYDVRQEDPSHRAVHAYPEMSIAQICAEAEKVRAIMHPDSIMWLWTTNHHMRFAFEVLDAWGFEPRTILTWVKNRFGTGDWLRGQTEHCILATRGKPIVEQNGQSTVLHGPLRADSQKPDQFFSFVESLCPAPRYAYLFARNFDRERWDGHGDEAAVAAPASPETLDAC
jgi:N6-adenosine-specific RNA methylase IME4/ParB-like chromosome segregation protein Spo0J